MHLQQAHPGEVVVVVAGAARAADPAACLSPGDLSKSLPHATLRLRWLPGFLAVCASCDEAGHNAALPALVPGDDGASAPSSAAAAAAAAAGSAVAWADLPAGRPFKYGHPKPSFEVPIADCTCASHTALCHKSDMWHMRMV